jgi:T-complex protein 1 subunit eta
MMNPQVGLQPGIILLKNGTDTSQGKGQLISNINACQAVVEAVRTTLGPRGMDKLISTGDKATISNDGAEIMKLLDIVHPAAKTLVDIARAQDAEIGDGTTTVVLTAGSLLREAKGFIEDGVHPQIVVKGYRMARKFAMNVLEELAMGVGDASAEARRTMLEKCAKTSLNSKLIAQYQDFFAPMVVDAMESLDSDLDLSMVGLKKVPGGSVTESFLVQGVAFKRTFSYAGFEQQPKKFVAPKILLLNVELELKSEKENAEIRIDDPSKYQSIVDAEWDIIYEKLDACVASGAQIILSRLPIGDLATQYFADRGLFCAGRVSTDDMRRVARATGGKVQTTVYDLTPGVLGTCGNFEERQVGAERYNLFMDCPEARTASMVLRGGAQQFIEETVRSLHDSLMIVKNTIKSTKIVAGGGAIELEMSRRLKEYAMTIDGKLQLVILAYAKALEMTPKQLAENAGFDSTDIVNRLRAKHAVEGGVWFGVDIEAEGICDTFESGVWEPVTSKSNSLSSATEAACMILSIDETVRNPQSQPPPQATGKGGRGMGGGVPMSQALGGGGIRSMMGRGRGIRAYQGKGGK